MDCRNCVFFPCLKVQCSFGNKQGCEDFLSIVENELNKIDKKAIERNEEI